MRQTPVVRLAEPSDADVHRFAELAGAAWADDALAARYIREPDVVLAEFEINLPAGCEPPPLPPRPSAELSVEDLEYAVGGAQRDSATALWQGSPGFLACYASTLPE